MNWRGRPLTSHEVIVNSHRRDHHPHRPDACTPNSTPAPTPPGSRSATTRWTPCRSPATTGTATGTTPCTPGSSPARPGRPAATPPRPAPGRPHPDLAWLTHPAITGLPGPALDALTAALTAPAAALREAASDRRRGYRPRQIAPGTGPRPRHTLTTKLTAAILHHRHGLPNKAIAVLYQTSPETISRHISDIRRLLAQTGHTIQPAPATLATLDDLYRHATTAGITIPAKIKPAC